MALAIVLGVLSGFAGFLPLYAGLRLTRRTVRAGLVGSMGVLLIGLLVSFVLIFMLAIVCIAIDRALGLPFVVAEVIGLSAVAIGYGIRSVNRK